MGIDQNDFNKILGGMFEPEPITIWDVPLRGNKSVKGVLYKTQYALPEATTTYVLCRYVEDNKTAWCTLIQADHGNLREWESKYRGKEEVNAVVMLPDRPKIDPAEVVIP